MCEGEGERESAVTKVGKKKIIQPKLKPSHRDFTSYQSVEYEHTCTHVPTCNYNYIYIDNDTIIELVDDC